MVRNVDPAFAGESGSKVESILIEIDSSDDVLDASAYRLPVLSRRSQAQKSPDSVAALWGHSAAIFHVGNAWRQLLHHLHAGHCFRLRDGSNKRHA